MDALGTDIKSSWELTDSGDLKLVKDEKNIVQSIVNRLNCWLDSENIFYLEYGSVLSSFLGWKRNDETLAFIKIELENTLNQDPRLGEYELEVDYGDDGQVEIHLDFSFDDADLELSLVISEDGTVRVNDANIESVGQEDEEQEDDDVEE